MKPSPFAILALLVACNTCDAPLPVASEPGYPCGVTGLVCPGSMCCSEGEVCGGTVGCPIGACCYEGPEGDGMAMRKATRAR